MASTLNSVSNSPTRSWTVLCRMMPPLAPPLMEPQVCTQSRFLPSCTSSRVSEMGDSRRGRAFHSVVGGGRSPRPMSYSHHCVSSLPCLFSTAKRARRKRLWRSHMATQWRRHSTTSTALSELLQVAVAHRVTHVRGWASCLEGEGAHVLRREREW